MIALIDGDELAYKIASTYQKNYYGVFRDDKFLWRSRTREDAIESIESQDDLDIKIITEVYDPVGYKRKVTDFIDSILFNTNSDECVICLSGDANFRYSIATLKPYKGNREGGEKPGHYLLLKDYLTELEAIKENHLEADDLLASNGNMEYEKYVICSSDKDLKTVPSNNFNMNTRKGSVITPMEAMYNFYYQLLIGDDTDNIPHPYNLGGVTASKILAELKGSSDELNYYQTVRDIYPSFLEVKDKEGNYKTKWYNESLDLDKILWEIGNLLWMHRTIDIEERWNPPINKEI